MFVGMSGHYLSVVSRVSGNRDRALIIWIWKLSYTKKTTRPLTTRKMADDESGEQRAHLVTSDVTERV